MTTRHSRPMSGQRFTGHLAWWFTAVVLCGSVLAGTRILESEAASAKAAPNPRANAQQFPPNSLNYPPIGPRVETMVPQAGGGYAIVIGGNCTAEILNCTTYVLPYVGTPVYLVIVDRTTLNLVTVQPFGGGPLDAEAARSTIQQAASNEVLVILGAPLAPSNRSLDPSWADVIKLIVPEPGTPSFNGLIVNIGGWSAIGVPAGGGLASPVGHLNAGRGDYYGVTYPVGNLAGYLHQTSNGKWNFTTGGFASFNTSVSQTAQANTMRINGVEYASGPLVASNGASCVGGFQLVVVNATTFSPLPPSYNVPVNQTFGTNCNNTNTDIVQIDALGAALGNVINGQNGGESAGAAEGGALVFLQSIGNPIVATQFSPQQEQAARVISPFIEQLGGVADAFNKSWWYSPAPTANPGYALAGSTALLGDAPSGAQVGVYASEASSAATGYTAGAPVILEGLLKRNSLGRYEPVAASTVPGAQPGLLPVTVYQPSQPWPYDGTSSASVKNALVWFSNELGLQYASTSSCYVPSFDNVRAEYCDTNPAPGTWDVLAQKLYDHPFPGESACRCTLADWTNVQTQLSKEMTWVHYIQQGLTTGGSSLTDVLTDSTNPSFIDLQSVTNQVLDAVGMSGSSAAVAGFWITLASNALKFAANFVGTETGLRPVVGVLSTIGPLGENLASLDSNTTLGRIKATAAELPAQLSNRFVAATQQLGLFQSIIASDYGKLQTLGESQVFQGNPFTDETLQTQVKNGVMLFAFGRLLGAGYNAYGLLPDSWNPGYPGSPADYYCGNVGTDGAYPFGDAVSSSAGLTWVGFTYPNMLPGPLPVYGGNPNLLVLASFEPDWFSVYSIPPTSVLQSVVTTAGLGDWPVWFFRHNFTQTGFRCSQLGSGRQRLPLQGKASNIGVRGDKGQVRIDTTVTEIGPIDLGVARLALGQILMESDRGGELVRTAAGSPFLPVVLTPARGSKQNRATFKTPAGAKPIVTVEVTNRDAKSGRLEVSVTVDRATLPRTAERCETEETALLRTRFALDDGVHPPVIFSTEQPWACKKGKLATP